ncbi:MAG: hypothetical protein P8N56_05340 [Schleiferiaceae bacterium]|nr:hypothetical protein [Schleiferiaceae bacterium]
MKKIATRLILASSTLVMACSQTNVVDVTPDETHEVPFEMASRLDTVELGESRVYAVHYTWVGGIQDTSVVYYLSLYAGSTSESDTLYEFLNAGDTVEGDYIFINVPVSSGVAAYKSHLATHTTHGK